MNLEGFVLAGGRSSRFGSDKARAVAGSRTLLDHALGAVRGLGVTPRVVTRTPLVHGDRPFAFVISERPAEGPAEGVRAALRACAAPWALILAVDMPAVDAALLRVLLAAGERAGPADSAAPRIVCFAAEGRRHPFPGLYPVSLLDAIAGARSMQEVLDRGDVTCVEAGVPDLARRLRNVNRPEDLGGVQGPA